MSMEIVPVDPFDVDAVRAWNLAYELAEAHDRGANADTWTFEEALLELQQQTDTIRRLPFRGVVDGETVMSMWAALPQTSNRHLMRMAMHVAPAFRRRGHATQALAFLESIAREEGRTTILGEVVWPYDLGSDGRGSPGVELAQRHGYALALGDVQRRLDLPVAHDVLTALAADAAEHHGGYTIQSFTGPIPEQYVAGWAALDAVIDTDSPTGDLDIEPGSADVAEVREQEQLTLSQGRTIFNALALTASGEVAAYTQMVLPKGQSGAKQWGTLVRAQDRGHRLGTAVKVAGLALLQRERPDVEHVRTYNAESNVHMIAVNDALGFRPVERLGEFQKHL